MNKLLIGLTAIMLALGVWACEDDAPAPEASDTKPSEAAAAPAPGAAAVPTVAQLKAEAAKEITEENVEAQAEALLKEIDEDLAAEEL